MGIWARALCTHSRETSEKRGLGIYVYTGKEGNVPLEGTERGTGTEEWQGAVALGCSTGGSSGGGGRTDGTAGEGNRGWAAGTRARPGD